MPQTAPPASSDRTTVPTKGRADRPSGAGVRWLDGVGLGGLEEAVVAGTGLGVVSACRPVAPVRSRAGSIDPATRSSRDSQ